MIDGSQQRPALRLLPYFLLFGFTLPFAWPLLGAYFSGDDLMNLNYHRYQNPPWRAIADTLMFWTTYRRPFGGVVYLATENTLYAVGKQP